jgi:hypothetical protein
MNCSDDLIDLEKAFTPEGLAALKDPSLEIDAGFQQMSWHDYFSFLDEMRPSYKGLLEITACDSMFELK